MLKFTPQIDVSAFRAAVAAAGQPILLAFLADTRTEMQRRINAPKSGRRGRSRPGQAPARQTGRLADDMNIVPIQLAPELHINAPYAERLEYQMDRPFAQVSVDVVAASFKPLGF